MRLGPIPVDPKILFEKKVNKTDACWLWMGALASGGYGSFRLRFKTVRAHRASYEFYVGFIPKDLFVLHKCDVRRCVNPGHLYAGTRADNVRDAQERNRLKICRGEENSNAILTWDKVDQIRRERPSTTLPKLAEKFGVSRGCISNIVSGREWAVRPLAEKRAREGGS